MQTGFKNILIVLVLISGGIFSYMFAASFVSGVRDSGFVAGTEGAGGSATGEPTPDTPDKRFEDVPADDFPSAVSIPSIGVDAEVVNIGINKKGDMATPKLFKDVGWYSPGTVPGNTGSAIFAGHLDNGIGLAGVFIRLNQAAVGDEVEIKMNSGKILTFKVTDISMYDYNDPKAGDVFNDSSGRLVKLITCSGEWLASEKTYGGRLVVTAKRVQ